MEEVIVGIVHSVFREPFQSLNAVVFTEFTWLTEQVQG